MTEQTEKAGQRHLTALEQEILHKALCASSKLVPNKKDAEITRLSVQRDQLLAALNSAPRPSADGNSDWLVRYMDWFFKERRAAIAAVEENP